MKCGTLSLSFPFLFSFFFFSLFPSLVFAPLIRSLLPPLSLATWPSCHSFLLFPLSSFSFFYLSHEVSQPCWNSGVPALESDMRWTSGLPAPANGDFDLTAWWLFVVNPESRLIPPYPSMVFGHFIAIHSPFDGPWNFWKPHSKTFPAVPILLGESH